MGNRGTSGFGLFLNFACVILKLFPLIVLMVSAFKEKINQKSKMMHMVCYAIGVLVPWASSFGPYAFNYIFGMNALIIIRAEFRPIIFVALFAFASFKLMQTESEKKVADAVETYNDKLNYYIGLIDQGVISSEEFGTMKSKMKKVNYK